MEGERLTVRVRIRVSVRVRFRVRFRVRLGLELGYYLVNTRHPGRFASTSSGWVLVQSGQVVLGHPVKECRGHSGQGMSRVTYGHPGVRCSHPGVRTDKVKRNNQK